MILSIAQLGELFEGVHHFDSKNARAVCPQCGRSDKFFISTSKNNNPFQCLHSGSCGYSGTAIWLWKKAGHGGDDYTATATKQLYFQTEIHHHDIQLDARDWDLPVGWKRIYHHPYLEKRKFTEYEEYMVGISTLDMKLRKKYVVFAIENTYIKGYVGRLILPDEQVQRLELAGEYIPRYRNSKSDFDRLLFGLDELVGQQCVILVEGIFDKFAVSRFLRKYGMDGDVVCLATFGANFTHAQAIKIKQRGVKHVLFMFDPDAIKKTKKAVNEVKYMFEQIGVCVLDSKDPDTASDDELAYALLKEEPIDTFNLRIPFFIIPP
jgi:hypothetical protein